MQKNVSFKLLPPQKVYLWFIDSFLCNLKLNHENAALIPKYQPIPLILQAMPGLVARSMINFHDLLSVAEK